MLKSNKMLQLRTNQGARKVLNGELANTGAIIAQYSFSRFKRLNSGGEAPQDASL